MSPAKQSCLEERQTCLESILIGAEYSPVTNSVGLADLEEIRLGAKYVDGYRIVARL